MAFLLGRNNHHNKPPSRTTTVVNTTSVQSDDRRRTDTTITTNTRTIQDNLVRIQTFNHVSDKYDILDTIGQGSMGAIYKVRIKPNKLGGSAFYPKKIHSTNTNTGTSTVSTTGATNTTNTTKNHHHQSLTSRFKTRLLRGKIRTTGTNTNHHQTSGGKSVVPQHAMPWTIATSTAAAAVTSTTTTTTTTPVQPHYDENVMNRHVYALKTIRLDTITDMVDDDMIRAFLDEMINEMNILRSMDHPNIIKAHEIFMTQPPPPPVPPEFVRHTTSKVSTQNQNIISTTTTTIAYDNDLLQHQHMCIALELCTGGDLYRRTPYREMEAAYIVEQILNASRYMHDRGIVHRDLKFENILFRTTDPAHYDIKILDFGLSKQFQQQKTGYMYERVGTIYTMAPEVLINDENIPYTAQAEVWSIGVIAYMLLCPKNTKPFHHSDFHTMIDLIQEGKVNYDAPVWDKSDLAKDFVRHLLQVNPYQRYTIVQALQHPFIQQRDRTTYEIPSRQIYKNIECSIQQYSQQETTILKKLALSIIAHDMIAHRKYANPESKSNMNHDNDNDNTSSSNNSHYHTIDQLQMAFVQFDTEKNGILSYDEFKTAILQTISQEQQEEEHQSPQTLLSVLENRENENNHHSNPTISQELPAIPSPYTEEELKRIFASLVRTLS